MSKIRLAIVDDEKFIRESLKIILSTEEDIEVCGLCGDGEEAYKLCMEKCRRCNFDGYKNARS